MSGDGHWLISTRDPSLCSYCNAPKVKERNTSAGPHRYCAVHWASSTLDCLRFELRFAMRRAARPLSPDVEDAFKRIESIGDWAREAGEMLRAHLDADPKQQADAAAILAQRDEDERAHAEWMGRQ